LEDKWKLLIGMNFANSLFIAYILILMYFQTTHSIILVEKNQVILLTEVLVSISILGATSLAAIWSVFFKKNQRNKEGLNPAETNA
jgi:hypothetical protein